ncbi:MAG: hypothetical protein JXB07_09200 [Anaerolineae bacterium]|nr:hypothetical protein [Anaerolineae bacterium]
MFPAEIALPRVLTFPADEPIGWIDVQPWQPQDEEPWLLGYSAVTLLTILLSGIELARHKGKYMFQQV